MLTQYCVGTVAESFLHTEQRGQQNQTFLYEIVSRESCTSYLLHKLWGNYSSMEGLRQRGGAETKAWVLSNKEECTHRKQMQRKTRQIANCLCKVSNTEQLMGISTVKMHLWPISLLNWNYHIVSTSVCVCGGARGSECLLCSSTATYIFLQRCLDSG